MMKIKSITLSVLSVLLFVVGALLLHTSSVAAISASAWRADRIIDDPVFFNPNTMTTQEIQTFLNSKVPVCDSNGTQPYAGTTRAAYSASKGVSTPFICLKDYSQNAPNMAADSYCGAITGGSMSAASIIKAVSMACNVNPQAIIVLLQKEQGLVTDDWPWPIEYTAAAGYGCPDTASCDSSFSGFFNQVYYGARQYQKYAKQPQLFNYAAGQNSFVAYKPGSGCGGTNLTMSDQATAGLYNYTPYQPNQAALNAGYGTGDGCSSYGNRNFWLYFNDWFNPGATIRSGVTMQTISQPSTSPVIGQTLSYTISFTNNLTVPLTMDAVGIVGRAGSINGSNRDFGWQGPITFQPGETKQFTFTSIAKESGSLYVWPAIYYQGAYVHYNNWGALLNVRVPNFSLASPLSSSITNPIASQTTTLTATIKNNESQPIRVDSFGIPVRFFGKYNYDIVWTSPVTIAAGATQAISGNLVLDKAGPYTTWVSTMIGNQFITLSPELTLNVSPITPNFQLSYTETPDITPALGEDVAVKFKLKNNSGIGMTLDAVGVVGRYDNPYTGANRDFGWVGPETFAAGEEKSYTAFVSNVSDLKNFYAWIAINYQGRYIHYNNWGFMMTPHIPNLTTSVPVTVNSGTQPTLNQSATVTATIKNNEPNPIKFSALGIPARYYGTYNYDVVWQGAGVLAASGQSGDSVALNGTVNFDKSGPYTLWASIYIQGKYITIGSQKTINL